METVSFQLAYEKPLILPEKLKISYYHTGCYNEDNKKEPPLNFVMLHKGEDMVVYYNWYEKGFFILFTRDNSKEGFSLAFSLVNINADQLTPSNVYSLRDDYREEEDDSVYPYRRTMLGGYDE